MLQNLIVKRILKSIISSLKGKKKWLVIIALAVALVAQNAGLDVAGIDEFVTELINLLNSMEG